MHSQKMYSNGVQGGSLGDLPGQEGVLQSEERHHHRVQGHGVRPLPPRQPQVLPDPHQL